MRVHDVPAKYAPAIERAIRFAMNSIHGHMQLETANPNDPALRGFVSENEIDRSRTGSIVITVAEVPADSQAKVFELESKRVA